MDYEASLDRAFEAVPEFSTSEDRLSVPEAEVQKDGAFTRLVNLGQIADTLSREPDHLHSMLQRELGTMGKLEDGRARYSGTFTSEDFDAAIEEYMEEFVLCSECGLPDTRLVMENRTHMLRCDACGAFRPVTKRRRVAGNQERAVLEEGQTYEVKITGTGRKGDGVAEKGKYTIFVPGAQKGDVVTVYIKNISGTLAFAQLSQ